MIPNCDRPYGIEDEIFPLTTSRLERLETFGLFKIHSECKDRATAGYEITSSFSSYLALSLLGKPKDAK